MNNKKIDKFIITLKKIKKSFAISGKLINSGLCADFATAIWKQWTDVNILSDEDMDGREYTHTFLFYKNLYYDAECLHGTEKWQNLPIFNRQKHEMRIYQKRLIFNFKR